MASVNILWADDEIELLRPHIKLLENKGFSVTTALDGQEALDAVAEARQPFRVIILDENMPGMGGLDAIPAIKRASESSHIVMLTKSEEENIMNEALGKQISDYLIKPITPAGIYACINKLVRQDDIVRDAALQDYQQNYGRLQMQINSCSTWDDWMQLHQTLTRYEMQLEGMPDVAEMLKMQLKEANSEFGRFVRNNYQQSLRNEDVLFSHKVIARRVLPLLEEGRKVVFIVIDNFKLDQWMAIQPLVARSWHVKTELYCGLLPTSTQYARNAMFAGLLPKDIAAMFPQYWNCENENSANAFEKELLEEFMKRYRKQYQTAYYKINDTESAERIIEIWGRYKQNHLNALVYNFIDMLSHARTEVKAIKELAPNDAAYRNLTVSWYKTGGLEAMLQNLKGRGVTVVITTDHGSVQVNRPQLIKASREINTNLRYKTDKNLAYNAKELYVVPNGNDIGLPQDKLVGEYVFAMGNDFFCYPPNRNSNIDYKARYTDTIQHGGISMSEMLIPLAILE